MRPLARQLDRLATPASTPPGPAFCTHGPRLYRVRLWTEAQWDALPEADRPTLRERVPGLGWAGAVPVQALN